MHKASGLCHSILEEPCELGSILIHISQMTKRLHNLGKCLVMAGGKGLWCQFKWSNSSATSLPIFYAASPSIYLKLFPYPEDWALCVSTSRSSQEIPHQWISTDYTSEARSCQIHLMSCPSESNGAIKISGKLVGRKPRTLKRRQCLYYT